MDVKVASSSIYRHAWVVVIFILYYRSCKFIDCDIWILL